MAAVVGIMSVSLCIFLSVRQVGKSEQHGAHNRAQARHRLYFNTIYIQVHKYGRKTHEAAAAATADSIAGEAFTM